MKGMSVQIIWLFAVALGVLSCSEKNGCSGVEDECALPPEPDCVVDNDCANENFCLAGICQPIIPCSLDSDCYHSYLYCSETLHRCEYLPYCQADSDCTTYGSGLVCDSVTRYCIHATADGDSDSEAISE